MAYLVAVTACVSGVAHTCMAAERLEKLCQLEKWGVSIETQGALGTENRLADEDIRRADVALLITDIELAGAERFEHCRYVQCSIYAFLREPQRVMSAVRKSAFCAAANPSYSGVVGFSVSWLWYCRRYSDGERSVFLRNRRQK
ncbi:fructose-like specific PTS system EIIB component 3 [Escherichia coli]|uniref:protein-N(pi)-phosphohistidine--D-fructose phosphotransferase n=2 Tax=Escherichia coli TaxID=562 RepID=A0A376CUR0_ECOLX|nr:fructose-like specific PTS system EIIB component 3 [Escherichia coli]